MPKPRRQGKKTVEPMLLLPPISLAKFQLCLVSSILPQKSPCYIGCLFDGLEGNDSAEPPISRLPNHKVVKAFEVCLLLATKLTSKWHRAWHCQYSIPLDRLLSSVFSSLYCRLLLQTSRRTHSKRKAGAQQFLIAPSLASHRAGRWKRVAHAATSKR